MEIHEWAADTFSVFSFSCGDALLDNFIKVDVIKETKIKLSKCFILINDKKIIGYYTLSPFSIPKGKFSNKLRKKFKYSDVPAYLLGRLAIDKQYQGRAYGERLVSDVVDRILNKVIPAPILCVHSYDSAINFYKKYDFIEIPHETRPTFILPL